MQVPSGIGGSASTIAFATWNRRFGSVIKRLRSASFGGSLVMSLFLRFDADLRGMLCQLPETGMTMLIFARDSPKPFMNVSTHINPNGGCSNAT